MKIRITKGGLYGLKGEIPVGTELTVAKEPTEWRGRYEVISGDTKGKEPVTNPAENKGDKKKSDAPEQKTKSDKG